MKGVSLPLSRYLLILNVAGLPTGSHSPLPLNLVLKAGSSSSSAVSSASQVSISQLHTDYHLVASLCDTAAFPEAG